MSNPPHLSPFDHRVHTVTTLLAFYMCTIRRYGDATEEELLNILDETLWEGYEDILRRPTLQLPWSERLSAFWDIHLAGARARPTLLSRMIFIWVGILIDMPIFLIFNFTMVRRGVVWAVKLVVRWARCLWAHHERSKALVATIRNSAQLQLPGMTDEEADGMAVKITFLGMVAVLLGVHRT